MKIKFKGKTYVLTTYGVIAFGCLATVVVGLIVAMCLPKKAKTNGQVKVVEESKLDESYDAKAGKIDKEQYATTILGKSEDAGKEYIEATLFLGDSNTARFLRVNDKDGKPFTTVNNTIGVVGMGVDAIGSVPCMQFASGTFTMVKSVEIIQPERIIITFGTNNLSGKSTDATSFIERYSKQLKSIVNIYPSVDLIVNAIPPVAKRRAYPNVTMTQIDAYNIAIAKMCEKEGWKFLDSTEALKDEATGFAKDGYMIEDGLHLSANGIHALFKYIRNHAYITEDDRPKPLKDIPAMYGVKQNIFTTNPLNNEKFEEDPSALEATAPIVEEEEAPQVVEEVVVQVNFSDCTNLAALQAKASANGYSVIKTEGQGQGPDETFVLGAVDHTNKTVSYSIVRSGTLKEEVEEVKQPAEEVKDVEQTEPPVVPPVEETKEPVKEEVGEPAKDVSTPVEAPIVPAEAKPVEEVPAEATVVESVGGPADPQELSE